MGYDIVHKCKAVIEWAAEENEDFDTNMVESILNQVTVQKRHASDAQEAAVDNIIRGFKIDLDKWG